MRDKQIKEKKKKNPATSHTRGSDSFYVSALDSAQEPA